MAGDPEDPQNGDEQTPPVVDEQAQEAPKEEATGTAAAEAADEGELKTRQVGAVEIGKLYLFEYDPKYKEKLPYYDRFPLAIPIGFFGSGMGFMGLNTHYLPGSSRIQLFNALKMLISDHNYTDETRLEVSYTLLQVFGSAFSGYTACLKRYLYGHVRSPFQLILPASWEAALAAPLEEWVEGRRGNGV